MDSQQLLDTARRVLSAEHEALRELAAGLDESFARACELMLACAGRVIVSGMGKSGHVGQKIAASLTSTGTAAHFLHPAEAVHGDVGVVLKGDLLLAISLSGETGEILGLLPPVRHIGAPVVAITGGVDSTLARQADVTLMLPRVTEADPHNLVPTTSTTMTLALGDALTVALMEARGFGPRDFAAFHPQGMLGKRLTLQVGDLLRGDETNPQVPLTASFGAALEEITNHLLGGVSVVDGAGRLAGIITDGDVRRIIRRFIVQHGSVAEAVTTPVSELMITSPTTIHPETLAYEALKLMESHRPRPIFLLPVVDAESRPVGMLHLHTLVQAGFTPSHSGE